MAVAIPVVPIVAVVPVVSVIPIVEGVAVSIAIIEMVAVGATVAEAISIVSFAMMTIVVVMVFVFVLVLMGDGADEQCAAADGWWIGTGGRFNVAEPPYQTERGQLIARTEGKAFSGSEYASRSGVRTNPHIRLQFDHRVIRVRQG